MVFHNHTICQSISMNDESITPPARVNDGRAVTTFIFNIYIYIYIYIYIVTITASLQSTLAVEFV